MSRARKNPPKKRGRAPPSVAQRSLGQYSHTFVADAKYGKSVMTRQVTRQTYYNDDEEADFNPEIHVPDSAQRIRMQTADLCDPSVMHVDAYAEYMGENYDDNDVHMPEESPQAKAQYRNDLHNSRFMRAAKSRTARSDRGAQRVVRARAIATSTHNEALVHQQMRTHAGNSAFDRLAAAQKKARVERRAKEQLHNDEERRRLTERDSDSDIDSDDINLDGPVRDADDDSDRLRRAFHRPRTRASEPIDAHTMTMADAAKLLPLDPFGALPHSVKTGLKALPELAAVHRLLRPYAFVDERDKRHFNLIEIVLQMNATGALWCETARVHTAARLAELLDRRHYGQYIVPNGSSDGLRPAMLGGHEHYDDEKKRTSFIVVTFRCTKRSKENNKIAPGAAEAAGKRGAALAAKERYKATQLTDHINAEARDVEAERNAHASDDEADIYADADDHYEGGVDIMDASKHYIYLVQLVFVEAFDVIAEMRDETGDALEDDTHTYGALGTSTASSGSDSESDNVAAEADEDVDDDDESSEMHPGYFDIFAQPANKTLATEQPPATAIIGGDVEFDYNDGASASESGDDRNFMPAGTIRLTLDRAKTLAGKWHAHELMGWCNGGQRPAPLCFRAFRIST